MANHSILHVLFYFVALCMSFEACAKAEDHHLRRCVEEPIQTRVAVQERETLRGPAGTLTHWEEEWLQISQNNSRKVFNFGIGSLFSFASRQYTQDRSMPQSPPRISQITPGLVAGIRREFTYCGRYRAISARYCAVDEECPNVFGAFFEVTEHEYPRLREREKNYSILRVSPIKPLPSNIASESDAFYFTWGPESGISNGGSLNVGDCAYDPLLSQAYWDVIIGGILSWNGQLKDTGRYTWDLGMELYLGQQKMQSSVAVFPSYTLSERLQFVEQFLNSTAKSNFRWIDDRKCPYTGNSIVTPTKELLVSVKGDALGTVAPISSKAFEDIVDDKLVKAGWDIKQRVNPCDWNSTQAISREDWSRNPYYEDAMTWGLQLSQLSAMLMQNSTTNSTPCPE